MIRTLTAVLLLAPAAAGQIVLYEVRGSTQIQIGPVLDLGRVSVDEARTVALRVRNTGTAPAAITRFSISGAGFALVQPSTPFSIPAGGQADAELRFQAAVPAAYSANLQVNNVSVIVLATAVPAPVLTIFPVCAAVDPRTIDFGSVTRSQLRLCNFNLQNTSAQVLTISTLTVTGTGFEGPVGRTVPFTLAAGQATSFAVHFTPPDRGVFNGALTIETQTYVLRGVGIDPPLPRPAIDFETTPLASNQQRRLTVRLPSPAPAAVTGSLNLVFLSDVAAVSDDPAVVFLPTSARSVTFSVAQGSTEVQLNGSPSVVFQTGTTAGRIRFSFSGVPAGFTADPTTVLIIPPGLLTLDSATASRSGSSLDVRLVGFDNTYTAGAMSFSFFDTAGRLMDGGAVQADFTGAFRSYFGSSVAGSAFQAGVRFPVTGDALSVTSVEVQLTNAAGTVRTQRLNFP